jgi:hypothetical protein
MNEGTNPVSLSPLKTQIRLLKVNQTRRETFI